LNSNRTGGFPKELIRVAIVGTVGVPARYGGFETLAENLVRYSSARQLPCRLTVYCSKREYVDRPTSWFGAELVYVPLRANGVSSIPYDVISLFSAVLRRNQVILLLGVSGAVALPVIRLLSRARIITNVDGMEWKREKWGRLAQWFLRFSERIAVRFSQVIIADSDCVAKYLAETYGCACEVIAYGGDHALAESPIEKQEIALPGGYALALCRIEPENNVAIILDAFSGRATLPLVFIGNWNDTLLGRKLRKRYNGIRHLYLLDPIYEPHLLRAVRDNAVLYIHGHSAGGTNPSLVEMMHFGLPILAYDCGFNRYTTGNEALFFNDAATLGCAMDGMTPAIQEEIGVRLRRIARTRYVWNLIGEAYFRIMGLNMVNVDL